MSKQKTAMQELIDWIDWFKDEMGFRPSDDQIKDKAKQLKANDERTDCIRLMDWLITECILNEDQSIWIYQGEDYSLEGILDVFYNETYGDNT